MVAHKVDAGEVQVPAALRALRRMEQPRVVRIRQFLDLLEFRGGLEPIRRGQLFILHTRKRPRSGSEIVIVAGRQSSAIIQSRQKKKTTHRVHLLARRPYPREQPVLHQPDTRHLVPAEHLHDDQRRHDRALLDHAQHLG